jgi:hypothetical protein
MERHSLSLCLSEEAQGVGFVGRGPLLLTPKDMLGLIYLVAKLY